MVESSGNAFILSDVQSLSLEEFPTPFLCEIWNWQGDTSVLPYKVRSICLIVPVGGGAQHCKRERISLRSQGPEGKVRSEPLV